MLSLLLCLFGTIELPVLLSSESVQIGEPIHCTVDLSLVDGSVPVLDEQSYDPGSSWAVLSDPVVERCVEGKATLSWSLFALEPMAGALPTPLISSSGEAIDLVAPSVTVAAALVEGEDEPRPARGFYVSELESEASGLGPWPLIVGGLAVLAFALWRSRRKSTPAAELELCFSARLDRLRAGVDGDASSVSALHSELTHLLRAAYGDESSGWSDEEWVERADLSDGERAELRGVFSACAEVKYGGARPTRFAVEETLERAQALLAQSEVVAA
jgi:hypothetical protein